MKTPCYRNTFLKVLALSASSLLISQCSNSGDNPSSLESTIVDADYAYASWPNGTTSDSSSDSIASKVLISDLDEDGVFENIFLSELANSTNKKSSILRITQGENFQEIINFKSTQTNLLKDSIPFSIDLNEDGSKELIFVNYDRDKVYAFEFKNNLNKIFIRWQVKLPQALPSDFEKKLTEISYEGQEMIKVGSYGLYEYKNKKVKVVTIE